jgi:hypothetical protein
MTWIDLGDPLPRTIPEPYAPVKWDVGEVCSLPSSFGAISRSFSEILDGRVSHHKFGALGDDQLSKFLWMACRTRAVAPSKLGFDLEHRAAPSAGAIHPIHVVIKRPSDNRWWLYEPRAHKLLELKQATTKFVGLYDHSLKVLEDKQATRFLFLAEPDKTLGKYQNGCSLVWRDAGALLGVMALTAAAQELNFCPLGITGEPWASALSDQGKLVGVGLALLGVGTGS